MEHNGYVLIADITGYTTYLNESELDHARGTLRGLLELLVEHTRPPLVISGLEGDAVFSYGLEETFVDAQTFLETIEDTYVSFRRAIELMILNNTCECNACANVSSLDLKFFVHFGSFTLEQIGDSREVIGRDVNLVHRLLKNSVTEQTGIEAYMLCTGEALENLDVSTDTDDLVPHTEHVEDFGKLRVWVKDMHPVYEARADEEQILFDANEVIWETETEIAMPPPLVWDYMSHTEYRNLLSNADDYEVGPKGERIGKDSVYQCYHGDRPVPQIVLEWRPFERLLIKQANPLPGPTSYIHIDYRLTDTEGGTLLTCRGARPTGSSWQRWLAHIVYRAMRPYFSRSVNRFGTELEQDLSRKEQPATPSLSPDLIGKAAEEGIRAAQPE